MGDYHYRLVCEKFSKKYKKTIVKYLEDIRFDKLTEILKKRKAKNYYVEVAWSVGLRDLSAMAHLFKRRTGMRVVEYHKFLLKKAKEAKNEIVIVT